MLRGRLGSDLGLSVDLADGVALLFRELEAALEVVVFSGILKGL